MPTMAQALDSLYTVLRNPAVAGELVEYHIGTSSVTALAILQQPPAQPPSLVGLSPGTFDLATPNPKNVDHDFSILAADLQIGGVPILPAAGHEIKRTFGGAKQVYQLGTPSWEWHDPYDKCYLIHAKFVRTEEL